LVQALPHVGGHDLALRGYDVTVFEGAGEPGGMMRFGIPEYRLPRTLIRAEIDKSWRWVSRSAWARPSRRCVPASPSCARRGFEAVFLSVGVFGRPRPAGARGRTRTAW